MLTVVFATLGTGVMLNQDITTGVFDRFRSLPIARWAPLGGAVLGDIVRYMISVAVTLGFGMILGFHIETSPLAAAAGCLLLLLFAASMCWFSALLGLLVKTPQGVQWFGFLVMFPLVFGSNLLVPVATMPGWLQAFVKVNPVTALSQAERALLTGGPAAAPVVKSLLWALAIFVVFAPLAVRVYRRKTCQFVTGSCHPRKPVARPVCGTQPYRFVGGPICLAPGSGYAGYHHAWSLAACSPFFWSCSLLSARTRPPRPAVTRSRARTSWPVTRRVTGL